MFGSHLMVLREHGRWEDSVFSINKSIDQLQQISPDIIRAQGIKVYGCGFVVYPLPPGYREPL
jgi:hypothetical protein